MLFQGLKFDNEAAHCHWLNTSLMAFPWHLGNTESFSQYYPDLCKHSTSLEVLFDFSNPYTRFWMGDGW